MFLCSSVSLLFSSKQAISSYFLIFWVTLHWRWACADKSKALSLWRSQTKCFHQEPASITFHYCPARKRQSLSSVYFCLHLTAQETYCAAEQELKAPRCAVFTAYYKCSEDYRLIYSSFEDKHHPEVSLGWILKVFWIWMWILNHRWLNAFEYI